MLDLVQIDKQLALLTQPVMQLIEQYQCLSEHELIGHLQKPPYELIDKQALRSHEGLFCTHFLLRHILYRIQKSWYQKQSALLSIELKLIQKKPFNGSVKQALAVNEQLPLRDYYLDLTHLLEMDTQQVDNLLTSFWQRYIAHQSADEHLQCLGLKVPSSAAQIEHRYRQLAMQHHPDKGGDRERFMQITHAYQQLKRQRL